MKLARVLPFALAAACGSSKSNPPMPDAGPAPVDAAVPETIVPIAPTAPALPSPPALTPCPTGWREIPSSTVSDHPVSVCDPFPPGPTAICPIDQAIFTGGSGCEVVGPPCGAGDWAEDLPSDRAVIYVRTGTNANPTGTNQSPYHTIADGVAAASSGAIVAVAKGTYDEAIMLPAGITIVGACVGQTLISSSTEAADSGAITVVGLGAGVERLRISGRRHGLWIGSGASVDVKNVVITAAEVRGMMVTGGGRAIADHLVIRDTRTRASDHLYGRGLQVEYGSFAQIARSVLERNTDTGMMVLDPGTMVSLADVVIRGTKSNEANGGYGRAIEIRDGPTASLTRFAAIDNHEYAIVVRGDGTSMTLGDALIRGTSLRANGGTLNAGVQIERGATATIARASFDDNVEAGLVITSSASVIASDLVIARSRSSAGGRFGWGLDVQGGGKLELHRAIVRENRDVGVWLGGTSHTRIEDLVVLDTGPEEASSQSGRGLDAHAGAIADISRAELSRNREFGAFVSEAGTMVTFTDLSIIGTISQVSDQSFGVGIAATRGATLTISRAVVSQNRLVGFAAGDGAVAHAEDIAVVGTDSDAAEGMGGNGIEINHGARLLLVRALVSDNRNVGILSYASGSRIDASELRVVRTKDERCAATTCAGLGGGFGAASVENASLSLRRFVVSASTLAGLTLVHGGTMDASMGEVSENPIGANVETEGFDFSRISSMVSFKENGVNLDSTQIAIPKVSLPSGVGSRPPP